MKTNILLLIFAVLFSQFITAQQNWQWTQKSEMPTAISNNAVVGCKNSFGDELVYSFAGIDTSKIFSGISNRAFKYEVAYDNWTEIDPLPDANTKIAAGASFVKGKIYIIGGYTVLANGNEISSHKVHIFDVETDMYLNDGTDIPVAIDDQVQAVYKDSLIYVITGWSNSTNVANVQIYDTYNNAWQAGTPVPNSADFRVFGGSGEIIGDTIYYVGGARFGFNFPLGEVFRKGYINPANPTEIEWTMQVDSLARGYRQGVTKIGDTIFWIGGSDVSYNFNGIAYNGSGGVSPNEKIIRYTPNLGKLEFFENVAPQIMDLRGIANTGNNLILCGGMSENQEVVASTFEYTFNQILNTEIVQNIDLQYFPNPTKNILTFNIYAEKAEVYDLFGNKLKMCNSCNIINLENLNTGIYIIKITKNEFAYSFKIKKY